MVLRVLRITKDTVFKLRPEPLKLLASQEQRAVMAGTSYEIVSYAYADINGSFNGHIKFSLKNQSLNGFNTWFVPSSHAQVEFDGVVVYPQEDQETLPVLWINQDTTLKRRPLDSGGLTAEELAPIKRGTSLKLHSYAFADAQGEFNDHIKFAIYNQDDFINGFSTWFVYDRHAFVEFDGDVVYPPEDPKILVLRVLETTVVKRRPVPASALPPSDVAAISKGTLLKLDSYAYADAQGSFNDHIKLAIKYVNDNINGYNTWYIYDRHARVEQNDVVVYPSPKPKPPKPPTPPSPPAYMGRAFKLPGNTSTFYTDQPIIPGGNFLWGEATKNATRIPETEDIVRNILALARQLQRARNQIDRPFTINSWYRPPAANAAVGGASRSQHLYGRAADVRVSGMSGRQVANAVMLWWDGGVGVYSNIPNIVHLDVGSKRTWGF